MFALHVHVSSSRINGIPDYVTDITIELREISTHNLQIVLLLIYCLLFFTFENSVPLMRSIR